MKTLLAITVLVAAVMPAWGDTDHVSQMWFLHNGKCVSVPQILAMAAAVPGYPRGEPVVARLVAIQADAHGLGTDIMLDQIVPGSREANLLIANAKTHDGTSIQYIRPGYPLPTINGNPLNAYIGQQVAIMPFGQWSQTCNPS